MTPPTHPLRRSTDALDLDLDLRDAAREGSGVIDLSARMRPVGGRRSSRQTHTRLLAALSRIQATSLETDPVVTDERVAVAQVALAHGTDR